MPTVPTFAVRETDVSRTANVGTVGKNGLKKKEKKGPPPQLAEQVGALLQGHHVQGQCIFVLVTLCYFVALGINSYFFIKCTNKKSRSQESSPS